MVMPCFYNFLSSLVIDVCGVLIRIFVSFLLVLLSLLLIDDPAKGQSVFFFFPVQQACGFEYTSKLQRMFQDIGVSKDLNDKFKSHLTNTGALDCELSRLSQLVPVIIFPIFFCCRWYCCCSLIFCFCVSS